MLLLFYLLKVKVYGNIFLIKEEVFMKLFFILRCIFCLIIEIVFVCAGLLIFAGGIMVFLDMRGFIKSPIGYDAEAGQQIAIFYTLGGLIWSIVTGVVLVKSIKTLIGSKNKQE